jgi:hypothetical protein
MHQPTSNRDVLSLLLITAPPPSSPTPPVWPRALECLLTELARVRMHGFSDKEYERAVRMLQVGAGWV